jgi:hypothetical protein
MTPSGSAIYTTIALMAWVLVPPILVALFGGLGAFAYLLARLQGLRRSRCWHEARHRISGAAFLAGIMVAISDILRRFGS